MVDEQIVNLIKQLYASIHKQNEDYWSKSFHNYTPIHFSVFILLAYFLT